MTKIPSESWDIKGLEGDEYPKYKVGPICGVPGCTRLAEHAHHIVRRSHTIGPYSWVRMPDGKVLGNVMAMCVYHHALVTDNKANVGYEDGTFIWDPTGDPIEVPTKGELEVDHSSPTHDREMCPTCKRPMPRPKIETPSEEPKMRATWACAIPVTERENGYETLETLLEEGRLELDKAGISYSEGKKVKYYVLATILGLFVQHADSVLGDA